MAAVSSCFSLTTAHAQMKAVPSSLEPIGPWAKAVCSRVYMPNSACSLEVCYSPCSWNPVLSPSLSRKGVFRLSSSSVTQEGMQLESEAEEEKGGEEEDAQETAESSDDIPSGTKVYLGNLPFTCDSAEVAGIIQEHGSVEMVEQYGGRTLRVNLRDKSRTEQRNQSQHRVYIGNLSWDVNAEILSEVFREYGNLLNAKVVYDRATGRSRGFGFINFSKQSEAEAAVASLNGKELEGRTMRVDLALSSRNTE